MEFLQRHSCQGTNDDHGCYVVQHGREQHRQQAIEYQQSPRIAAGLASQRYRHPRKDAGPTGDFHKQTRPENDGDHAPVNRRYVDWQIDEVVVRQFDRAEDQQL